MGLSASLSIAQSALSNNAALSTIVSRNIAGVNDPNYSTKTAQVETVEGGVRITGLRNATDDALFQHLLVAKAGAASSAALSGGLDQIEQTLGLNATGADATSADTSPATLLGKLNDALQSYADAPADATLGQAAVTAAKRLAANLNGAASAVQSVRLQADQAIGTSVATINGLLGQFKIANDAVVNGTVSGADVTGALDNRNAILSQLSSEIGITTATTGNGGLAIYTDGGATLFQGSPRTVSFSTTGAFAAGTTGSAVMVDGVPVTGPGAVMATQSGRIAGLTQLRDVSAVDYGNQLDQIAGGLISTFAETDQTGGGAPAIAGLFMSASSSALPVTTTGLAATITVSTSVDPTKGGSVALLRDGGINAYGNPAYTANSSGAASYAAHLNGTLAELGATRTFDATTGGAGSGTLAAYAASSVGWLEAARSSVTTAATETAATVTQTTTSLSSATGVNLDEQLSKMLELEHSYQASAELMTTIKTMLDSLLQAVH